MLPLLHGNALEFENMCNKDNYLVMKRIDNQFIALDKKNELTVWCMKTGAMIHRHIDVPKNIIDSSEYEVYGRNNKQPEQDYYSKGLFSYSLLYKKIPVDKKHRFVVVEIKGTE